MVIINGPNGGERTHEIGSRRIEDPYERILQMDVNHDVDRSFEMILREITELRQAFEREISVLQREVLAIRRDLRDRSSTPDPRSSAPSSHTHEPEEIHSSDRESAQISSPNLGGNRFLLTVEQVADMLGVSGSTVRRMAARGELPIVRIGLNSVRIPRRAIDAILAYGAEA